MINTSANKNEYTIQSGVVDYPIGFPFYFNPDRTPQLLVKIGDEELRFNHNFELSEDKGSVVLRPTEEESWTLEGPEDFSWMTKWDGKDLLIKRAIPFVQDSDYQLGRISSEQIERDFDLSVMRDQILADKIDEHTDEVQVEVDALHSRIDFVQEEHSLDMAAVDEVMATKATKTELANVKTVLEEDIQSNTDAIQETREDYIQADTEIRQTLSNHESELTTLRDNQTSLSGQVSGIAEKIPESASDSNPLVTKEDLESIDLEGYATTDYVDNAILALPRFRTQVVDSLPSVGEERVLYLVRKTGTDVDSYDEYIWVPDVAKFEFVGTTQVDLTGYATTDYVDTTEQEIRDDLNGSIGELRTQITGKQDQLTAGENITIVDNVISATGGGGGMANVVHDTTLTGSGTDASPLGLAEAIKDEIASKAPTATVDALTAIVNDILTTYLKKTGDTMTGALTVPEFTVSTAEGTLSISVVAGVPVIASNNGIDIASRVKFDYAPTTDDNTTWTNALDTSLVSKRQVASAISSIPVGIDSVVHDDTLTGNGTDSSRLGVNTEVIATKEDLEHSENNTLTEVMAYLDETVWPEINSLNSDKQDKLTAGENITIVGNVISATGGGGTTVIIKRYS